MEVPLPLPAPRFTWPLAFALSSLAATMLAQPLNITLTPSDFNGYAVSCFGEKDGSIVAQVTGGAPPYQYRWSSGQDVADIVDLPAGYYSLRVSDVAGGGALAEIMLLEPNAIKVGFTPVVYPNDYNISCWECHNGMIYVDVYGGAAPYTYVWNDGLPGTMRTGLGAKQQYSVEVTDANGCTAKTQKINLTQPERNDWGMQGNSGTDPATYFIGTSDSKDLVFKSNNAERLRLKSNGALRLAGLNEGVMLLNSDFEIVTATARKPWCWPDNPDLTPWYVCGNDLESDAVHFLGTVNDKALNFRTNNIRRMSIMREGKVHIGEFTQTPPANSPYLLLVEGGIATRDVMVKLGTWSGNSFKMMPYQPSPPNDEARWRPNTTTRLKVYPNPSAGRFTIERLEGTPIARVDLFDAQGKAVPITWQSLDDGRILCESGLPVRPGIYMVRTVAEKGQTIVGTVHIQH